MPHLALTKHDHRSLPGKYKAQQDAIFVSETAGNIIATKVAAFRSIAVEITKA